MSVSPSMSEESLSALEQKIGYRFRDRDLLIRALTHSSTADSDNYERLEFLGDRVLGLVMAAALFETFPGEKEGGLAKRHAVLVQGKTLASIATAHGLGEYMILSHSERSSGGGQKETLLADVMESLMGAVYLDGGLDPAKQMILDLWGDNIRTLDHAPQDPKTELQEWVQARGLPLPDYRIASRSGPDHAPVFTIEVAVEGHDPICAEGPSRRQAEKTVACIMLRHLKGEGH